MKKGHIISSDIIRYSVVLILLIVSIVANAFEVDGIQYNLLSSLDKTCCVTYQDKNKNDYSGDIIIPEIISYNGQTYTVISIGDDAFRNCDNLISVSIPNSVTEIGTYAFYSCGVLTNVTLGNTLTTIGENAFGFCTILTDIIIPNTVTEIGTSAFYSCKGLTEIIIPDGVTEISTLTFAACSNLSKLTLGYGVIKINASAFGSCSSLEEIYVKNYIPPTLVGSSVFEKVDKENCILYVHKGCEESYANDTYWGAFVNIQGIMFPEEIYEDIKNDIENTQDKLNEVWGEIEKDYPDVAEGFKDDYNDLKNELEDLLDELEEAYNNGNLDEELADELKQKLDDIITRIEKLLEMAAENHANYELYIDLINEINGVETTLDEAWENITSDYYDVADNYKDDYESLKGELEALHEELDDAYKNGTLTDEVAEDIRTKLEEISQEITDLLDFVKQGEEDYLHDELGKDLEDAKDKLDEVWDEIENDCPDVADDFKDDYNDLKDELDDLLDELEDAYNNGTLDDEFADEFKEKLDDILQRIGDLLEVAKQAEANYLLYTTLIDEINGVETTLDEAWETITTDYADVADNYKEDYEAIKAEIDTLRDDLEDAYNNGTLDDQTAEEIRAKLEEIKKEIEELLVAARTAHEALDGISSVFSNLDDDVQIYNLSGARVNTPTKGNVYIFRYNDGTTKKVLAK